MKDPRQCDQRREHPTGQCGEGQQAAEPAD